MPLRHLLVGAGWATCACAAWSLPLAMSDFDLDADGWEAVNGARQFAWVADGGHPGGFIQAEDRDPESLWFFRAPSSYLGDRSTAYGGWLSYALRSGSSSEPLPANYADLQLLGVNGVLLAFDGDVLPASQGWSTYAVDLVANGSWKVGSVAGVAATPADLLGVLADLKELRIRGDYRTATDITALDAVALHAAPIPEPATSGLLLGGLAALGWIRRRRQPGSSTAGSCR